MNHEELEEFCDEIDINGDGVIDFEEFIEFIDAKAGERAGASDVVGMEGAGPHSLRKLKNEL